MVKEVFEILATTPEKLTREIGTMTRREMQTRPAPDKWSVQEVLAHLDDLEETGMRARVAAMLEQDKPQLFSFDQLARAKELGYAARDARKSLASLARQRRANIKFLRKIRPSQMKRSGVHPKVGEITVEELITEWAFHDLGHLKQILEIKRYALYPRIGNMRAFYQLS
jgi:hypothetical protein